MTVRPQASFINQVSSTLGAFGDQFGEQFRTLTPTQRSSTNEITIGLIHASWIGEVGSAYHSTMRIFYNKLVRDRIPEVIQSHGHQPFTRILDESEYRSALLAKLLEEAQEAQAATEDDLPLELADVLEVLQALTKACRMTWEGLESAAIRKREQRGGFSARVFLEYIEKPD